MKNILLLLLLLFAFDIYAQRDYYFRDSSTYELSGTEMLIAGKRKLYLKSNENLSLLKDFSVIGDSSIYIRDVDVVSGDKIYVLVGSMYIGGNSVLFKSNDKGKNWEEDSSYYVASKFRSINQVQWDSEGVGYLFDGYYQSSVLRSKDGGKTWQFWFESLIAHYFQIHFCASGKPYLIGLPGDGFPSYSFEIPDSLWKKDEFGFYMSGCHNKKEGCIRVFRTGITDRETNFIQKQQDTLSKLCGQLNVVDPGAIQEPQIEVFPNPFSSEIYVQFGFNGTKEISLYSSTGERLVWKRVDAWEDILDLRSISKGVYFLSVKEEDGLKRTTQKLLKLD